MKNWLLLCLASLLCASCAVKRLGVDQLDVPISLAQESPEWRSEMEVARGSDATASIGDTMFVVKRYRLGQKSLYLSPPAGLGAFPALDSWRITHTYNGATVFTSNAYYGGAVGFLADAEGNVKGSALIIQVSGVKAGRTWRVSSKVPGKAFGRQQEEIEVWGLRYGGRKGDQAEFHVVDRLNPNVAQVVQYVTATDAQLRSGFVVKGVLIKVTSSDAQGSVIGFQVADVEHARRVSDQPRRPDTPKPDARNIDQI